MRAKKGGYAVRELYRAGGREPPFKKGVGIPEEAASPSRITPLESTIRYEYGSETKSKIQADNA